jgi:putative oxidoreductase
MNVFERWRSWAPWLLSLSRIVVGFLFMQIGTGKLWGFPAAIMPGGVLAQFGTQTWWSSVLEVFGGGLILLGLFTRPVAFLLSGEMAFAYFIGHAGGGFWPVLNGGAPAIFYCFYFLYLSATGAGPISLDALLFGKRRGAEP